MKYFLTSIIFLTSCVLVKAHSTSEKDSLQLEKAALIKVAHNLEDALLELRQLEKAKAMRSDLKETHLLKPPQGGAMSKIVKNLTWEGPLESLLSTIAEQYHYKLGILGKKPALPILVSIFIQQKPLGAVIQDADLQAGSRAHISVYEELGIIELRYASSTT